MNNALPLTPPSHAFSGSTTVPERRASAIAHGAALAAANPAQSEKITAKILRGMTCVRVAPSAPRPEIRSRLPLRGTPGAVH